MNKSLKVVCFLSLSLFLFACSGDEINDEDQVRRYIDTAKTATEERSYDDIAVLLHSGYSDHKRRNKTTLLNLVRQYFFMHDNIHLLTRIDEMVFHSENKVKVIVYVAMAGNVISDASVLSSLRAKVYRFELQLIKQDEWLLQLADWQRSSVKEMMQSLNTTVETI